ncbi:MAG: hypothetical protein ACP5O7_12285 [Phycisphaerae bacterium]
MSYRVVTEVEKLTVGYVRRGGKDNRQQQRKRMLAFAAFCATLGARNLAEVGHRHVKLYWRSIALLSPRTRYAHWLALRDLWALAGKTGSPMPPPTEKEDREAPKKE